MTLLIKKGQEQAIRLEPDLPASLPAPVAEGDPVGGVRVSLEDRAVGRVSVVAAESVPARGLRSGIDRFWRQWPLLAG